MNRGQMEARQLFIEARDAIARISEFESEREMRMSRAMTMTRADGPHGKGGKAESRQQQRRPATDMRSHGSSSEPRKLDREPRDINEAFQIMRERRKAGNR